MGYLARHEGRCDENGGTQDGSRRDRGHVPQPERPGKAHGFWFCDDLICNCPWRTGVSHKVGVIIGGLVSAPHHLNFHRSNRDRQHARGTGAYAARHLAYLNSSSACVANRTRRRWCGVVADQESERTAF